MDTIGIRELRDKLAQTLRRVEAGERIEVTRDGEPIAVIAPLPDDPLARLVATGAARPPVHPFRVPRIEELARPMSGRSASTILLDGRRERLS